MIENPRNYIMVYINGSYETLCLGNEYEIMLDGQLSFKGRLVQFKTNTALGDGGEELVLQIMLQWYHFDVEQIIYIGEVNNDTRN